MKILVDDQPVSAQTDLRTVEDAVRAVQAGCAPDRVVVQLRCDGREVQGEEMATALGRKTSAVECLELFTTTRQSLVSDAMTQASAALQQTEQECRRVAEMLTQGRTREAMENFGECLRVWQQIHTAATRSMEMLALDPETTMIRDVPLGELITRPREVLLQVRDAVSAQDYVLLADVLQYELSEVTDQWYALVARIREEAEQVVDPTDRA